MSRDEVNAWIDWHEQIMRRCRYPGRVVLELRAEMCRWLSAWL